MKDTLAYQLSIVRSWVADTPARMRRSAMFRFTVLALVAFAHSILVFATPPTPLNFAALIAMCGPGAITIWKTGDYRHWHYWAAIAFVVSWIHPAVTLPTLIVADIWAMNAHIANTQENSDDR